MQKTTIHRSKTAQFSEAQLKYIYHQEQLQELLSFPFEKKAFSKQIDLKGAHFSQTQRQLLVEVLTKQYQSLSSQSKVNENIALLSKENTYTVTTGHQLSLFTGPLYFIYKILNAVKLAEELKATYPAQNFVPVFWMASEDHDFAEIQSIELFGKKISWETEQKGPVGRFNLNGFETVKSEVLSFFKEEQLAQLTNLFTFYSGEDLSAATMKFAHALFADFGVVIINADNAQLKQSFSRIVLRELETSFSQKAVLSTNAKLEVFGLKEQIHPREINLFYIEKGLRERINRTANGFEIENIGNYSAEEFFALVKSNPEAFSPNVVLRPLYQEVVLPNLCYIGGAGEIAYWLQLKEVFDTANVPFPLLSVRNSIMIVDPATKAKIAKTGLELEDFFQSADDLKKEFLLKNAGEELDLNFAHSDVQNLRKELLEKVVSIDASLEKMVEAEITKMEKQIHFIEDKLRKTIKAKHETSMNAIDAVKNKLFPGHGLQERSANFFSILGSKSTNERLQEIYEAIEPFEMDLIILSE